MPSKAWYCQFDGVVDGPFSLDELIYLVCRNRLDPTDQVRQGEEGNWVEACRIRALFPNQPQDTPKPEEPSPDPAPTQEETESEVSETPKTSPPPIPDDKSPVVQNLAIGAGILLLLLLLLLPFFFLQGGGEKETAKDNKENTSSVEISSDKIGSSQGDGNKITYTGKGTEPRESQGKQGSSSSKDPGTGHNAKSKKGSDIPKSENANSKPAEKKKDAATKGKKPIPTAINTIAYELDQQTAGSEGPEASNEQEQDSSEGAGGGSGHEGIFFGIKAKGRRFVYIVDRSGSMAGGPFVQVCEELMRSVQRLTRSQSFYVFFFSTDATPMFAMPSDIIPGTPNHSVSGKPSNGMLHANPKNIQALNEWVNAMTIGGSTNPTDALLKALKMDPKPDAIFLLSDGQIPDHNLDLLRTHNRKLTVSSKIRKNKKFKQQVLIPINTIGFENTQGEALLKQVAKENQGEYRFIPSEPPKTPRSGTASKPRSKKSTSGLIRSTRP